ncbi:MAG: apolipoprotein N-acyltransferase [Robiginitomaculum sp.]|nr:apolipoprotein N-acyltransferase [Robiginitomaculum sp.]
MAIPISQSLVKRLANLSGFRGALLTFCLGSLAVLGHAPFYIWPLTILMLAFLMIRLDRVRGSAKPVKAGFWTGFNFGFGYFLFGLYWVGSAFIARGPEFIPVMPFAVFAFCAGFALFWAVAGALYVKFSQRSISLSTTSLSTKSLWRAPLFAGLLFLAEFARGHLIGGFPWNLPGYIFPAGKPISQAASIIGIYGLSALVLIVASLLAVSISAKKYLPLVLGLAVLGGIFGFGHQRLHAAPVQNTQYVDGVTLRIIHANIHQRDKFDPSKYVEIANHYLRLSMSAGFDDVTHIIWPEGALPGLLLEDTGFMSALDQLMRSGTGDAPVFITQTLRAETRPTQTEPDYFNAAVAISFPANEPWQASSFYDKQRLVPFGEFIPGGKWVEKLGLKSLSTALRGMTAGQSGSVPTIKGLPPVSIQICYEIIFPGFTPASLTPSGKRPEWILNLSNDSWYGNSSGPRQHVNQARYRAIEQGVAVARTTAGGISGIIDPYGRQLRRKNLGEDGILDVRLPRPLEKTLYSKHVNFILLLLMLSISVLSYLGIKRSY